jgi:FKBP-type peptidyl-prolyl cis-trans isomerase
VQFGTRPASVQANSTAKQGDFVSVDYTGTLDNGTVFDTSRKAGRKPLEFVVGGGMVRHMCSGDIEGCSGALSEACDTTT